MARPASTNPTNAELAILNILWQRGPSTVRQVRDALVDAQPPDESDDTRSIGYTSVLKVMQIMAAKGLVSRDMSERTHVYAAALPARHVRRKLVGDLIQRAFAGSAVELIVQALHSKRSTPAELNELRRLIDECERSRSKGRRQSTR